MKKQLVCVAALAAGFLFGQPEAKAQGAYIKIGGGYNFAMGSDISYNSNTVQTSTSSNFSYTETYERVNINFGKGLAANGAVGFMFSEHLGFELGAGYLIGGKNEIKSTYTNNTQFGEYNSEASSRMLLIQPSFVISAGTEGINPYGRFGLVAAKGNITSKDNGTNDGNKFESEFKLSGGWGLGMQGGIGADFSINEKLIFFSEVTMSNLKYSPDNGELTKATLNGKDMLSTITTKEKQFEYVDEHTISSSNRPPDSEPSKEPRQNLPFGSVGIGLGIKFKF